MDLHLSDFMLDDLLNATYDLFKGRAGEKGILFEVKSELPGINVRSDREKIRQSLNCLVSNAIKFTHSGSVTVYGSADGGKLMIRVSDTGIGISKEDLPVIFDRFRQAETGFERSFGGSGLGLAISKGNVDFLGGSISVKSETGRGSDFIISIPVGLISGV
jgi:signal transduction histidine kinase